MKKLPFYTHGGFFHADEVTAYAICEMAGMSNKFVRLDNINEIPGDGIVADIGREYDPGQLRFDHHQGFICRENGRPYASAGMLWKHYGHLVSAVYALSKWAQKIRDRVDETLVQGIDAHDADNAYQVVATCSAGPVRSVTISHIIAGFNSRNVKDKAAQDFCFRKAVDMVQAVIISHVEAAEVYMEACEKFEQVVNVQANIITLSEGLPWKEIVHERHPEALFVISPSNHPGNPWSMIAVPVDPESREVKRPIERPEWFAGFIHQGKWIAGGASPEELKRLAEWNIRHR